jgi:hypothetical protein
LSQELELSIVETDTQLAVKYRNCCRYNVSFPRDAFQSLRGFQVCGSRQAMSDDSGFKCHHWSAGVNGGRDFFSKMK